MSLVEASELKIEFRLPPESELSSTILELSLERASRKILKLVGEETYADSEALPDLKDAEKYMAMSYICLNSGIRLRKYGFVKQETDSTSINQGKNVVNSYFSPKELKEMSSIYSQQAGDILSDYIKDNDDGAGYDFTNLVRG